MPPQVLLVLVVVAWLVFAAARSWSVRYRALRRLYEHEGARQRTSLLAQAGAEGRLARWLSLAGYRRPNASTLFVAWTLALAVGGFALGQFYRLVLLRPLIERVSTVPGSAGDVLTATLQSGPWLLFVLAGGLPAMVVRTARRARVRAIEQDLPLALEMLATMAEAGLGFDAALSKIARARGSDRPLAAEFTGFQVDMLAGVPRVQALRSLTRRVDVSSVTQFTSALVQAEQVGASIAETLQHQADDLRQRRREDALLQAQALPVKLVFPLVICFLPGIFVSTLAPVVYQMVQVANSVLRSSGR